MTTLAEATADLRLALEAKSMEFSGVRQQIAEISTTVKGIIAGAVAAESPEQAEYRELFLKHLQKPQQFDGQMKALIWKLGKKDVTLANTSGGFALPKVFIDSIDRVVSTVCPWLDPDLLGTVDVASEDAHIPLGLSDITAARASETATRNATPTPNFRDRVAKFGDYYALATVSTWAVEDIPGLQEFLITEVSAQIGQALAGDIVSGSGSGQVLGITNTSPNTTTDFASPQRNGESIQYVPQASASAIALGDIESLLGSFREGYLLDPTFAFVMRPTTLVNIYKTAGLVEAAFTMPRNPTLFGYPVRLSSGAPAIGANNFAVLAGAWRRGYVLCSRGQMQLTRNEFSAPGQITYHIRRRLGGCLRANDAVKALKCATS